MDRRHGTSTYGAPKRKVILDGPCSCRKVELRLDERSKHDRDGAVHSRTYCGPDRRVNRGRGGLGFWGGRDQRSR